jgi:hypothetical protein
MPRVAAGSPEIREPASSPQLAGGDRRCDLGQQGRAAEAAQPAAKLNHSHFVAAFPFRIKESALTLTGLLERAIPRFGIRADGAG